MLANLSLAAWDAPVAAIGLIAGSSFGALAYLERWRWTPSGRYGLANMITAFRFSLVVLMLTLQSQAALAFTLALLVLLLDGVDGWHARRSGACSIYGDVFDKEVDAFFTLSLSLILHRSGPFDGWILIPGALRYVYLLIGNCDVKQGAVSKPAARWTRAAGAFTLGSLTICLLPLGSTLAPIGAAATLVVTLSFAYSFLGCRTQSSN